MKKSIKLFMLAAISASCVLSCQNKNNYKNIQLNRKGQLVTQEQDQNQNQNSNNASSNQEHEMPMEAIDPGPIYFVNDGSREVSRSFVFQNNKIELANALSYTCLDSKRKKTNVPVTSKYRLDISSEPIEGLYRGQSLARVNVLLLGAVIKSQTKLLDIQISKKYLDLTSEDFAKKCGDGFISTIFNGYMILEQRSFLVPKDFNIPNLNLLTLDEDLKTINEIEIKYKEIIEQSKKSSSYLANLGISSLEYARGEIKTAKGYDKKMAESLTGIYKIKFIMDFSKTAQEENELSTLPFVQTLNYSDLK